jgi:hypothetical protein
MNNEKWMRRTACHPGVRSPRIDAKRVFGVFRPGIQTAPEGRKNIGGARSEAEPP